MKNFFKQIQIEWRKITGGASFISLLLSLLVVMGVAPSICINVYIDNYDRPEKVTQNVYKQLIQKCGSYQRKIESGEVVGEEAAVMRGKIQLFEYYISEHDFLFNKMAEKVPCDWFILMEVYYIQLARGDMGMDHDKELIKKVEGCLATNDAREYYRMELEYLKSVKSNEEWSIYEYYYDFLIEQGYPLGGLECKLILQMLDTELNGSVYDKHIVIKNRYALEHDQIFYADSNILADFSYIRSFSGIWPAVIIALDIVYLFIGIYTFIICAKAPRSGGRRKIKADSLLIGGRGKIVVTKMIVSLCLALLLCIFAFVIIIIAACGLVGTDEVFVPAYLIENDQVIEMWAIGYAIGRLASAFGYIAMGASAGVILFSLTSPKKYLTNV